MENDASFTFLLLSHIPPPQAICQTPTMTFVCTCFCRPPRAFTLSGDSPSRQLLPANGWASFLPPWRPTTCQVTVATGEEGTGPVAIDTYPPTHLVSAISDLHPQFLSEMPRKLIFYSLISDRTQSEFVLS